VNWQSHVILINHMGMVY